MDDLEMANALRAKGWRVDEPITKENCRHPPDMVLGTGSIGTDGSGSSSWHCRRCGAHGQHSWPANPKIQQFGQFQAQAVNPIFQKLNFGPGLD